MRQSTLTAGLQFLTGQAGSAWGESDWAQSPPPQPDSPQPTPAADSAAAGTSAAVQGSGKAVLQGLRTGIRTGGAAVRRESAHSASPPAAHEDGFWEHVLANEPDTEAAGGGGTAQAAGSGALADADQTGARAGSSASQPQGSAPSRAGARVQGRSRNRTATISRCALPAADARAGMRGC